MLKSVAFFSLIAVAVLAFAWANVSLNFQNIEIAGIDADDLIYTQTEQSQIIPSDIPLS